MVSKEEKEKEIKISLGENLFWGTQGKQLGWKPLEGRLVVSKKKKNQNKKREKRNTLKRFFVGQQEEDHNDERGAEGPI